MPEPTREWTADQAAHFRQVAAGMLENTLQANVNRLAVTFGWENYHTYDSRRSNGGYPDNVMVRGRRLLYAELKRQTGRLSDDQKRWLAKLRDVGGPVEVYVWRPMDWLDGTIYGVLR